MEGGSTAVKADGETQTTQKSYYPREGAISMLTPQIGINLSTITGDGQTSDSNGGLTAGVTMDLGRGTLVFETGALYRQEGAKNSNHGVDLTLDLDYISVPLLAKYYFNGAEYNSPFVSLGVMPSFLVSKKAEVSAYGYSDSTSSVEGVSSFVLDAMFALGGKFKASETTDIVIQGTYSRSLTSVSTNESGVANSVVGVTIGMGFNL